MVVGRNWAVPLERMAAKSREESLVFLVAR